MRAFIGIEPSDEVRAALARVQQELARCPAKVKWVPSGNVHLTLKFLGEIDDETAAKVRAAMAKAAGGGPFAFRVEGVGCFPPRGRPRTIWAGVADGADDVVRLFKNLDRALRRAGFEKERRFVPHLTIGRVKSPKGAEQLTPLIERHAATVFGTCSAERMVLFRSTLTPDGAVYDAVGEQAL